MFLYMLCFFPLFKIFKNVIVFGVIISSINLERYALLGIYTMLSVCFEI